MIEHFFGIDLPVYIFAIIVTIILLSNMREYIAKNYAKDSFLYRHFVTRLIPRIVSVIFGILIADLFWYFEIAGWIRFSFWVALFVIIMMSINKRSTEWPWENSR